MQNELNLTEIFNKHTSVFHGVEADYLIDSLHQCWDGTDLISNKKNGEKSYFSPFDEIFDCSNLLWGAKT